MLKQIANKLLSAFKIVQHEAPMYIFDLDGTLSLLEARRGLVQRESPDWGAFHKAATRDKPNTPVMLALMAAREFGCEIRIWSGRSSSVRKEAVYWLSQHLSLPEQAISEMLTMREEGDFTPDDVLKKQWLDALPHKDYMRIQAVYDDRQKVVDMWRANNIPCFQVAPGDF